jgi:hypothetical protein
MKGSRKGRERRSQTVTADADLCTGVQELTECGEHLALAIRGL